MLPSDKNPPLSETAPRQRVPNEILVRILGYIRKPNPDLLRVSRLAFDIIGPKVYRDYTFRRTSYTGVDSRSSPTSHNSEIESRLFDMVRVLRLQDDNATSIESHFPNTEILHLTWPFRSSGIAKAEYLTTIAIHGVPLLSTHSERTAWYEFALPQSPKGMVIVFYLSSVSQGVSAIETSPLLGCKNLKEVIFIFRKGYYETVFAEFWIDELAYLDIPVTFVVEFESLPGGLDLERVEHLFREAIQDRWKEDILTSTQSDVAQSRQQFLADNQHSLQHRLDQVRFITWETFRSENAGKDYW